MSGGKAFSPPADPQERLLWLAEPMTRGEALAERVTDLNILTDVMRAIVSDIEGDMDARQKALQSASDELQAAIRGMRSLTEGLPR